MTAKKEKNKEAGVTDLKYFDQLAPLFQRLHDDACGRDIAGNRELHFDQYRMLILLYMFNPVVSSLQSMQQASELKKVQQKLGCKRASLGSLSGQKRGQDFFLLSLSPLSCEYASSETHLPCR